MAKRLLIVAAASKNSGLMHFKAFKKAFKGVDFAEFIKELIYIMKDRKYILFTDNCNIHKWKLVQDLINENQITVMFNEPYRPEFKSIELIFSMAKRYYKDHMIKI